MPDSAGHNSARELRRTPLSARGEPATWLFGVSLVAALAMVLALLALIIAEGVSTFWPAPIDHIKFTDGRQTLGVPIQSESIPAFADDADESDESKPLSTRRLYRVGNRDIGKQPFLWIPDTEIEQTTRPDSAVMLERLEWGVWLGMPQGVLLEELVTAPAGAPEPSLSSDTEYGPARVESTLLSTSDSGLRTYRVQRFVAEDPAQALDLMRKIHPEALKRRAKIDYLRRVEVGRVNHHLDQKRLAIRRAEQRQADGDSAALPIALWPILPLAGIAAIYAGIRLRRRTHETSLRHALGAAACTLAFVAGLALFYGAWVGRPWQPGPLSPEALASLVETRTAEARELEAEHEHVLDQIDALEAEDARVRIIVTDPETNRFAPTSQTEPDRPLLLSQVVRIVAANDLNFTQKLLVYVSRWHEFLTEPPRQANTAGGIFPVIFGTVLLTILLSVVVVPLGVLAALYLREYARQGPLTSLLRIAINNLAGVPSIVYGVFGLGFFCYTVGPFIDSGPQTSLPQIQWWIALAGAAIVIAAAVGLVAAARSTDMPRARRASRYLLPTLWIGAIALVALLVVKTPYFDGLFSHRESSVFAARGLLWSSLTLALLTLPVVIVATEEAIAAVPTSLREGSYGCGASKWQTIRRVVLPGAMPGVLTGTILAMARGAGEVAPLMLVGAVKLAPELPISSEFPFIHFERSFMHLGFHIYDLGFQSPDSDAARPFVWTTTLLLITIVGVLNLGAVIIRSRLRARLHTGQF